MAHDNAGSAVAVEGYVGVVGAVKGDSAVLNTGTVHLFDITTGQSYAKLVGDQTLQGDFFGGSVAIADGAVAACGRIGDGDLIGSVYLFDAVSGAQIAMISSGRFQQTISTDQSLAMSDGLLAVGVARDNDSGSAVTGSVFLYDLVSLQLLRRVVPSDGQQGDGFGTAVAISDGKLIVGSEFDFTQVHRQGSVYVFDASTGEELYKLMSPAGQLFGGRIAADGNTLVVSARDGIPGETDSGVVHVFELASGTHLFQLEPDDLAPGYEFGSSVAVDDGIVVVGTLQDDQNGVMSGSAYVYDAASGLLLRKLIASNGSPGDEFGTGVAIESGRVLVGAHHDDNPELNEGSAYLFDLRCLPDTNSDGSLTPSDFTAWINAFNNNLPGCDQNADGECTPADFTAWIANFNAGC